MQQQQQHRSSNQSSSYSQSSQSTSAKKGRSSQSALDAATAAQMQQFASLAGLNPSLLSSLQLGAFDPKNPLLMPFAGGMPGLSGMSGLNNMNMLAGLSGLSGFGGLDPQNLAAMVAAAGSNLGNLGNLSKSSSSSSNAPSSKQERKSSSSQQSSSSSSNQQSSKAAAAAAAASANNFPFLFANPLYTPLGLGGLNPYSQSSNMSVYDQLAQQYSLLNGLSSGATTNTTTSSSTTSSSRQQTSGKSSSSARSSSNAMQSSSSHSPSTRGRNSGNSSTSSAAVAAAQFSREAAQLQSLLMSQDPTILETLNRAAGLDISQALSSLTGGSSSGNTSSSNARNSSNSGSGKSQQQTVKESLDKAEKERRKLMETLTRGALPPDLAAMQAYAQGKMPSTSSTSSKSSSQLPVPMPAEFSQALFAEMAAQAAAAAVASGSSSSSSSSKRREQEAMKDSLDQFSKAQMELFARNLGMGSGISLIPTSSSSSTSSLYGGLLDEPKSKRSRMSSSMESKLASLTSKDDLAQLMAAAAADEKQLQALTRNSRLSGLGKSSASGTSETTIEKVTLSPVAAASIAGLPPQTSITIAPTSAPSSLPTSLPSSLSVSTMSSPSSGAENLISPKNVSFATPSSHRSESQSPRDTERPPSRQHQKQSQKHHHEMDLEDLIAPSKVSKGNSQTSSSAPINTTARSKSPALTSPHNQEHDSGASGLRGDEHDKHDSSSNKDQSSDGDNERRGRRTRSKRPRSGEDFEHLVLPERKRELRSSAGRLAAAAAARHALEAKMASTSSHESLNLSTASSASDDRGGDNEA